MSTKVKNAVQEGIETLPDSLSDLELQYHFVCIFVRHGLSAVECEQAIELVEQWRSS